MSNYSNGKLNLEEQNTSWTKIFNYVNRGSTVLDFGCSSGELGKQLKTNKNCKVFGVEIDEHDFKAANKVLDGVYSFNIERETIPAKLATIKFDAIILADVIEHFVDPAEALRKLAALLKPKGRLIFSIPNMSHISVRMQLLSGDFTYSETGLLDKTHLHFYNYKEVKRIFAAAGYTIIATNANTLPFDRSFLSAKLHQLGLKDDGFIEYIKNDMHARTFQFVGYAEKSQTKAKQAQLNTATPEREFVDYVEQLSEVKKYHESKIEQLETEVERLKQANVHLVEVKERLEKSIIHRAKRGIRSLVRGKR